MTTSTISQEQAAREFLAWSESPIGFYVDQHWDGRHWVKRKAPIHWDEKHRRLFGALLVRDEDGQMPVSELVMVDKGKSAKSLTAAAVAQWAGMYVDNDAEIQLAANSREHAGIRVYQQLIQSLNWNPYGESLASWLKGELRFLKTNNWVRPVPMRGAAVSGANAIFMNFDEIWAYEGDRARTMMGEMKESPTRNLSFTLITSYPPFEGDDGPLNDTLNAFFDANEEPRDHVQPVEGLEDMPVWLDPTTGVALFWNREDYPWHLRKNKHGVTFIDRQRESYRQKGMLNEFLRIWEAKRVSRADSLIPEDRWDACEDLDFEPVRPSDGKVPMVVTLDAGWKGDSMGGIARSYNPLTQKFELRAVKLWHPGFYRDRPTGDILLDAKQWVIDLDRIYNVLAVGCDPTQLIMMMAELEALGIPTVEVNQNSDRAAADTFYRGLILATRLRNYPEATLKQHVMHAVAIQRNNGTIKLDKRKTTHSIDLAVADSMNCFVILQYIKEFEKLFKARNRPPAPPPQKRVTLEELYRIGAGYDS